MEFTPDVYSHEPTSAAAIVRARTPLRISFAGGGTDFPHWFEKQPGAVLCATVSQYARVSLYPRQDQHIRIRSVDLGYVDKYHIETGPMYNGMLDLAKAAIKRLGCTQGLDLDINSDAPPGSGLGGSSALTTSILGAVSSFENRNLDNYGIADLNYIVERQDLGIAGGVQDQYATTFGGFNLIEFSPHGVLVNPLRLNPGTLADLEAHLMMCYVGNVRTRGGLIEKQIRFAQERRRSTLEGMQRIYELVYEMKSALLRSDLTRFGELLHEGFVNKKKMNPQVTEGTSADFLYQVARSSGAIGGKLMGAGGGGYLLLYCETHKQPAVKQALQEAGGVVSRLTFEPSGLHVWRTRSW
jgi:D-glycero-alpha-D-manno-heptose-7-phosphate kinase